MLEFMDLNDITTDATHRLNVYCNYHFHYQFELLIVWNGEVHIKISGKEYTLHRGDIAFSLPFEPHSYFTSENSSSICIVFAPEIVSSYYKIINFKKGHKNAFTLDSDLFNYLEKMCVANQKIIHNSPAPISETEQIGMIYFLLSAIDRCCPFSDNSAVNENSDLGDLVLKYLSQHFLEPLTLESVATALNYNKSYLSRIIKKQTGKGFAKHLISLRIFHAARLIEIASETGSEISFSQVAFECGFNNIRSFNRSFKMIIEETPSKYLQNHRRHTKQQRQSDSLEFDSPK